MSYKYTHFIKQNIAPKGAKKIIVYNSKGEKFTEIALGGLTPPNTQKLYSFGLVSDIHIAASTGVAWIPTTKFDNALTYFENQGCAFCCVSGDLTQTGLYRRIDESDASTTYLDEGQLAKYKEICNKHTIPVYELSGNHESYYGMSITDNLAKWETYTGKNVLHYSVSQGNDLFVFIGQPHGSTPMSDEALQWLYETLEVNRNKRCFIFVHPDISSGNPLGKYETNRLFDGWGTKTTAFKNLLRHYKNTVLFCGHSHFMFECQELDVTANYTEKDGFRSIHVPSLSRPTDILDDEGRRSENGTRKYDDSKSYGYLVDVYDDCIVLNGIDFITNKPVPLGTFKIDTTLQTIEANTFRDSTGTITT